MRNLSLRTRLAAFWIFTLVVAASLALLLRSAYDGRAVAQISTAVDATRGACLEIQRKFAWSAEHHSFDPAKERDFQRALLEIVLDHHTGVEGGFWKRAKGFVAYAYPTYEGTGAKRDVPEAERPALSELAESSVAAGELRDTTRRGSREAIVTTACPIRAATGDTAAWAMTRVPLAVGDRYEHFLRALVLLLGFVLVMGIGSTFLAFGWEGNLRRLEQSIRENALDDRATLPPTGDAGLNVVVAALNDRNERLRRAREEAARLETRLAQTDRLAALGRMAAGIAHEIRNPLAAMRLRLENALVDPERRMVTAAPVIQEQMSRMDRLVEMMLAMTRPFEVRAKEVDVGEWLGASLAPLRPIAAEREVSLELASSAGRWSFDPFHLSRALENLVRNAVSFSPPGAAVKVAAERAGESLRLRVSDRGPGIAPALRKHLFEPFATARAEGTGTGLGLALAREIVEAHGGSIREVGGSGGAIFEIEVPWIKS